MPRDGSQVFAVVALSAENVVNGQKADGCRIHPLRSQIRFEKQDLIVTRVAKIAQNSLKKHVIVHKFAHRAAKMVFFAGKDIAPSKQGLTAPTRNSLAPTRNSLEGGGIRRTESYKRLRTLKMSHIGLFELYFCRLRPRFHRLLSGIQSAG